MVVFFIVALVVGIILLLSMCCCMEKVKLLAYKMCCCCCKHGYKVVKKWLLFYTNVDYNNAFCKVCCFILSTYAYMRGGLSRYSYWTEEESVRLASTILLSSSLLWHSCVLAVKKYGCIYFAIAANCMWIWKQSKEQLACWCFAFIRTLCLAWMDS